jgi:hypothetical protein
MPAKQEQRAEVNTFVQGLITEASPLNFPENASAEEENFELNRDGTRNRRLGMDLETGHIYRDTGILSDQINDAGYNSFKWIEVAGDVGLEFLVVQFNRKIVFFDLTKENLSGSGYMGEITLSQFPTNTRYSFSSIEGSLIAVAGVDTFAVISYENGSFSYYLDRIKIRDLFGIEETNSQYETDISYRGPLDVTHYYNLQNQSWGIPRKAKVTFTETRTETQAYSNPDFDPESPESPSNPRYLYRDVVITETRTDTKSADPTLAYLSHYGFAPSNSEHVWVGMQFVPVQGDEDPYEQMYMNLFKETWGTELKSAKGYYIIDALRRGQSRVEEINRNLAKYPELNKSIASGATVYSSFPYPSDYTTGGANCVAEFAGRIFFSGFTGTVVGGDKRSPNYTNYVFFSTLVKSKTDLPKCYQDGDPTSRETPDILDTDGGFLRISEAKNIISLINMGTSLIAIASNGVWSIDGGSDYGFSASNYKVSKLTTFGGISASTIVLEGNRAHYWAEDGIYTLSKNEFGDIGATSISLGTIQKFYEEIPNIAKLKATSIYDDLSKKVRWVFNTGNLLSEANETKELVLDIALSSFSLNRVMNLIPNSVNVVSLFQSSPYRTGEIQEPVYVDTEVVVSGEDPVIISERIQLSGIQSTKYIVLRREGGQVQYSFSYYNNPRFLDWETVNGVGVDAKAFCLTGSQTIGDSSIKKQIPYLTMHFIRTEKEVDINFTPLNQSGCKFRCQWNFANSIESHKWTPLMQAYRYRMPLMATSPNGSYNNGFEVVTTKNKVRGSGLAFALYFETEPLKDCKLLGWNIAINGNSKT